MPFRFRKIFSLGKGFRINLSKGGLSTSLGKPGATLNIGKRGARPTFGIPGSGLSFTPSQGQAGGTKPANAAMNAIVFLVSGILICIIVVCCLGVLLMPTDGNPATPTPETGLSIEQIIGLTSNAAQAQTLAASTPIPAPTLAALNTIAPTATLFTLANTPLPVFETQTPLTFSTLSPAQPIGGQCACNADSLNCSNFSSKAEAQACFDFCIAQGAGDIHKLDENNDGDACESLR